MMRRYLWPAMVFLMGILMGCTHSPQSTWHLVWSDDFNYNGLPDSTKWAYEVGYIRNHELQYYTRARSENARVEDGNLIIEARKDNWEGHEYTSASLSTWDKAAWQYGRIEVRAKLPTGKGMWPAIWMMGVNRRQVGWPDCGENDIMENVGFDPDVIHGTIHTGAYNHVKGTAKGNTITVAAPYNEYHIYALNWYPDHMDFFVDDQQYFTFKNEGTGQAAWPFDQKCYLKINAAIGGDWGGQQGVDDSIFPQKYYIDYVRVYQQDQG